MADTNEKIPFHEALLILLYIGFTDLIGIILVVFGVDDFLIIDFLTFPVTQFYFRLKGVRASYDLWMNVAEVVPYIGALPLRTIGAFLTIRAANSGVSLERQQQMAKGVPAASVAEGDIEQAKARLRRSREISDAMEDEQKYREGETEDESRRREKSREMQRGLGDT